MRKVVLIFPNNSAIASFIFKYRIAKAEVSSAEQSLSGPLSDDEITKACTEYGAHMKRLFNFNPF